MNIGFFSQGQGSHHEVGRLMVESAKKHMPDIPLYHLTDGDTEALAEPIRIREALPLAVKRAVFYAGLEGDWLFVDTDIIFTRDVRGVFDQDFDVAFAKRHEKCDYALAMPYNLGVCFSRNREFWKDIIPAVKTLPPKLQEWDGLQLASGWYASRGPKWFEDRQLKPYRILELPSEYNYAPASESDTHAAILHYKGKKKRWLGHAITSTRPN